MLMSDEREAVNMGEVKVGRVTGYFAKVGVAVIEVQTGNIRIGDTIRIRGKHTDFSQVVESMQMERQPIQAAMPDQVIGIKVRERVRENDLVYKVTP
jgi:putative protease